MWRRVLSLNDQPAAKECITLGIRIRRIILPRAQNKIENNCSPVALDDCSSSCTGRACVVCTSQRKWTQRENVVIEGNESNLLLSPIGIITNCAFNCDGRTDIQTQSFRSTISCLALRRLVYSYGTYILWGAVCVKIGQFCEIYKPGAHKGKERSTPIQVVKLSFLG